MTSRCFAFLIVAVWLLACVWRSQSAGVSADVGVAVRPTKLWRFLNQEDQVVQQRFRENVEEFSVGVVRCLRYCIESKSSINAAPDVLQLIWKLDTKSTSGIGSATISDKDLAPEILQGESIRPDNPRNTQTRCTFSIIIGCEISNENKNNIGKVEKKFIKSLQPNLNVLEDSGDKGSSSLNFLRERLVDQNNLMNETETSFHVQPNQAEISIVIFGNVSKVDLKIPIGEAKQLEETERAARPRLTLATTRMPGGVSGARLNVANPPPGGWRLRLQGQPEQRYRLIVASAVVPEFDYPLGFHDSGKELLSSGNSNIQVIQKNPGISSRQIKVLNEDVKNVDRNNMSDDSGTKRIFLPRMISDTETSDEQAEPKSFWFPTSKTENILSFNLNNNITTRMDSGDDIESRGVIDREFFEANEFSNPLSEELPLRKYLTVELNPRSELIANPGTYHRLTFDITNNHILKIRHYLYPSSSPFNVFGIPYRFVVIAPGQTVSVPVDIIVPPQVGDTVNKVTLRVEGIETVEKSANFYVRASGSRVYDDTRPTIDYYFNNNCRGRTDRNRCLKSYWSVNVVVQDSGTGLKSVTSIPKGIYPEAPYTSGTSSPVHFYYTSNCCSRVIEVTAVDSSGNTFSRRIDVDEWTNLTTGEILAIIFGVLLVILLIVLIVIAIVYCYKRRKSHDLSYSQRYGSRSSPQ